MESLLERLRAQVIAEMDTETAQAMLPAGLRARADEIINEMTNVELLAMIGYMK